MSPYLLSLKNVSGLKSSHFVVKTGEPVTFEQTWNFITWRQFVNQHKQSVSECCNNNKNAKMKSFISVFLLQVSQPERRSDNVPSLPPLRSDHCTKRSENTFLARAGPVPTQVRERVASSQSCIAQTCMDWVSTSEHSIKEIIISKYRSSLSLQFVLESIKWRKGKILAPVRPVRGFPDKFSLSVLVYCWATVLSSHIQRERGEGR